MRGSRGNKPIKTKELELITEEELIEALGKMELERSLGKDEITAERSSTCSLANYSWIRPLKMIA